MITCFKLNDCAKGREKLQAARNVAFAEYEQAIDDEEGESDWENDTAEVEFDLKDLFGELELTTQTWSDVEHVHEYR